jgi:hypothetical protein
MVKKISSFFKPRELEPTSTFKHSIKKNRETQASIEQLRKVVTLPKSHGCADRAELERLVAALSDQAAEAQIITALRQVSCYRLKMKHLEQVPLGKRLVQLRAHPSHNVSKLARSVVQKLRQDISSELEH